MKAEKRDRKNKRSLQESSGERARGVKAQTEMQSHKERKTCRCEEKRENQTASDSFRE